VAPVLGAFLLSFFQELVMSIVKIISTLAALLILSACAGGVHTTTKHRKTAILLYSAHTPMIPASAPCVPKTITFKKGVKTLTEECVWTEANLECSGERVSRLTASNYLLGRPVEQKLKCSKRK
jgi:hypothetical protein